MFDCIHVFIIVLLFVSRIPNAVGNVDIAPTILDMAGLEIPEHMDGRSLLKLIKEHKQANK